MNENEKEYFNLEKICIIVLETSKFRKFYSQLAVCEIGIFAIGKNKQIAIKQKMS